MIAFRNKAFPPEWISPPKCTMRRRDPPCRRRIVTPDADRHAGGVKFNSRGQAKRRPRKGETTLADPVRVAFSSTDSARRNQSLVLWFNSRSDNGSAILG